MTATITLFGNFGTQNLGNECTVLAAIDHLRALAPDARIECVCADPVDVSLRYGIRAVSMFAPHRAGSRPDSRPPSRIARLLRRVFVRAPQEIRHWATAFRALRGTRLLLMTGTGMLTDFGISPLGLHYEILKWTLVAKLRRVKVAFVSVGASRLAHPLSRWFVRRALALADYRSYRDAQSRDCLAAMGAGAPGDRVYPDLAFSLPRIALPRAVGAGAGRVVGVGLMDFYGKASRRETGEHVYRRYVDAMAGFTAWLLKEQYAVRLFIGDVSYDTRVIRDVIDALDRDRVPRDGGRLTAEPVRSVEQLLAELTATDMVVATRFHNVLLALLLGKPVLSVAYDPKIEALMAGVGLAAYSARVGDLAVDTLIDKFRRLEADGQSVRSHLPGRLEAHRLALDVQYGELTAMVRHASPAAAPRPSGPHTTAGLRTVPGEPGGAGRRASG